MKWQSEDEWRVGRSDTRAASRRARCVRAIREVHARISEWARAKRLTQATTIADREVVTVEDTVCAPATPLTAPLSGRSCVAYHAVARVRDGGWILLTIDEHRLVPFDLEIAGGEAVAIEGELAERPRPLIPRKLGLEDSFLARHRQPAKLACFSGFEESVIAIGDLIRVQGLVLIEGHEASEQLYRDDARRIRVVAHPAHTLTIGRR